MTHRTASLATITGLDRQAGTNASARAHGDGQSVRVAHSCYLDTLHTRAQRRAERHNRSHRAA